MPSYCNLILKWKGNAGCRSAHSLIDRLLYLWPANLTSCNYVFFPVCRFEKQKIWFVKPRLHERVLSRAGDAIFFRFCRVTCAPGWLHLWQIWATNWRPRESHTSRDLGTVNRHSYFNFIGQIVFSRVAKRQKVAGWLHGQLSLRFCRECFNSGDFFLAIFSPVPSPVQGWLHVRFSSRAGDATKFEKIASPARAKNRSCSRGLKFVFKWIWLKGFGKKYRWPCHDTLMLWHVSMKHVCTLILFVVF